MSLKHFIDLFLIGTLGILRQRQLCPLRLKLKRLLPAIPRHQPLLRVLRELIDELEALI